MNFSIYIPIIILWVIIFITQRNNRNQIIIKKVIERRRAGGNTEMKSLAAKFIDKECMIYAFDGRQLTGTIKEVADGAILVEKDGKSEAINLDFIMRIREYPVNKKGKKKSVVID